MTTSTILFAFLVAGVAFLSVVVWQLAEELAVEKRKVEHYERCYEQLCDRRAKDAEAHRRTVEQYEHLLAQARKCLAMGVSVPGWAAGQKN